MTAKALATGIAVVAVINAMFPTVTSIAPVDPTTTSGPLQESGVAE
jgi:hypothetical protein